MNVARQEKLLWGGPISPKISWFGQDAQADIIKWQAAASPLQVITVAICKFCGGDFDGNYA
jgi:hypothetical protein